MKRFSSFALAAAVGACSIGIGGYGGLDASGSGHLGDGATHDIGGVTDHGAGNGGAPTLASTSG